MTSTRVRERTRARNHVTCISQFFLSGPLVADQLSHVNSRVLAALKECCVPEKKVDIKPCEKSDDKIRSSAPVCTN